MKTLKLLTSFLFITTFSLASFSQNNNIIRITNTQIIAPEIVDFGTVNDQPRFKKFIIKNDRPNSVKICNIITPQGFQVSVNNKTLAPKSQTQLFIGVDPRLLNDTLVKQKITLETNLIIPIVINVQVRTKK